MKTKSIILFSTLLLLVQLYGSAQIIPNDPKVLRGVLENGFTYFIRQNKQPQKHAELYLVNKVGSILEDEDQLGLAHFMEHMNFNGTKNYPKNQMVDFLQKAGIRFGGDLNAYTGFEETVYQLPIPTDDPKMIGQAIAIMRDWAHEAVLDPTEIDHERGVVLEEARLGKGASDRMARQYYPVLLNQSRYAERLPIGSEALLKSFKAEVLRRFYTEWYRPDLQALIVVGDIDPQAVETMIRKAFGDLTNPIPSRKRTAYAVDLNGKNNFIAVTDPEQASLSIEILSKHKMHKLSTEQDYRTIMTKSLLNMMLQSRTANESSREISPDYIGVGLQISDFLGGLDMLSLSTTAKPGRLREAFLQTYRILERIKKHGFSAEEVKVAKANYLRSLDQQVSEKDKTPSSAYVKEYQELFLKNTAAPGIDWEHAFIRANLDSISKNDIEKLLGEYRSSENTDILITAPQSEKQNLPDSLTVAKWINGVSNETLTNYVDEKVALSLFENKPLAGKIISRKSIASINATVVQFSNGVKAILKPTDYKDDQIMYGAYALGGANIFEGDDYTMASNAAGLVSRMGYGSFSRPQLDKLMSGKSASSVVNINANSFIVRGNSSVKDIESALQLTFLQFTRPRKDSLTFYNTLNSAIAGLANRYADPNKVFADTMSYVNGNYDYRSAPPTAEKLSKVKLDRTLEIYNKGFGDASDFTFVFVGNFETDDLIPLLQRYLGGLPSKNRTKKIHDTGVHIPSGQIIKKVYKGSENKAIVTILLSGTYTYSQQENIRLKALGDILQIKVLEQLREAEGQVYSPQVQTQYTKYPQNRFALSISFGCAPENADKLTAMVGKEFEELRNNGPEQVDIDKFTAQYEKTMELAERDNGFWLNYILGQSEAGEDQGQIKDVRALVKAITGASLKKSAETFLSQKNRIIFQLLPVNAAK
ncbi:M16 family metallopeptidase [Pedobacter miscanthi]|uniref:Insulinase family protein n=1 Tax=Pedobacter miscanthi TaxID=2259170 RepID=A0A366LDW2_9SPHI|nr:insulinase family protein [Pedobacter miscanthi]RBQ12068.1 insulinase family protein [Pedobacter miscanthi]